MPDVPEPRIADVDRDRVSKILRAAYGEGRITESELEERLAAAYAARVASELEVVTADLPTSAPPVVASARPGVDLTPAIPLLLPAVVCTLIYFMTNAGGYFWPMWVWLGCGVPAFLAVFSGRRSGQADRSALSPGERTGLTE